MPRETVVFQFPRDRGSQLVEGPVEGHEWYARRALEESPAPFPARREAGCGKVENQEPVGAGSGERMILARRDQGRCAGRHRAAGAGDLHFQTAAQRQDHLGDGRGYVPRPRPRNS